MDALKGMDWDVYDRSIDVLISRLRQKLNDDPKKPKYIKTIRGSGYKFIGEDFG
jgi:DNA-binding response OmpR family regulator